MLILYCTYIDKNDSIKEYVPFISKYNQNRINRLTRARALTIKQIIVGELLLDYILKKHYSIFDGNANIDRTPEGKPFLVNRKLNFSISHSGRMVLCGCDIEKIGVDIQEIKQNSLYDPYKLSAMEAYFKMQEKKACLDSLSWKIDDETGDNIVTILDQDISYYIYQKIIYNKFIISLSTKMELKDGIVIKRIKYADLLKSSFNERILKNE